MTKQEKQIYQYMSFYRMILDGMGINALSVSALIAISLAQQEGEMIEPDENKRIKIADETIIAIKNGKSPMLEYNSKHDAICKRKLEGVTVRTVYGAADERKEG